MPTLVFLNGRFLTPEEARVSAFDAGFQHAVGLFETMTGVLDEDGRGRVPFLENHLDRLLGSARELGLGAESSFRKHALAEAVAQTLERSGLSEARIRLTITGGDLNLLGRQEGKPLDPTLMIVAQPATAYPPEMFDQGVGVVIADLRVNPLDPTSGHKTLNYWGRLRELQQAAAKGAGEALVFQVTNHVAGGCVSNLFLVRSGDEARGDGDDEGDAPEGATELWTPIARGEEQDVVAEARAAGHGAAGAALPSPVLPGITRGFVLGAAKERGLAVRRRMLSIDDVLSADEVFLTNSSWGVLPVVRVERERIGSGGVGPVTRWMRERWLEERRG